MYSIIVCSIRSEEAEALRENVARTIGDGVPFELIAYDNRSAGKGICQVYNECAERAVYDNLCFVHEDVEFLTEGWGRILVEKLSEPDCGVIGFAGSMLKVKACTGWHSISRYGVCLNYVQRQKSCKTGKLEDVLCVSNPRELSYSPVVPLDGMCQFVRKDVWNKVRFDQEFLRGFHCYDIDFTIAVYVAGYRNWVCHEVLIKHMSAGGYNEGWYEENVRLHQKWGGVLPLYAEDKLSVFTKKLYEFLAEVELTRFLIDRGLISKARPLYIWYYWFTHMFNRRVHKLLSKYYSALRSERK